MSKNRHFKTADQLGISPAIRKGLIWVLHQLEHGRITAKDGSRFQIKMDLAFHGRNQNGCGAVGCIGGWAAYHAFAVDDRIDVTSKAAHKALQFVYAQQHFGEPLNQLFYPVGINRNRIFTSSEIARELLGYLQHGNAGLSKQWTEWKGMIN